MAHQQQYQQQTYAMHPYYPLGVEVPGYVANETPLPILAAAFAGLLGSVIGAALLLSHRWRAHGNMKRLELGEHALICWFVLCGTLHCFFEGYFLYFNENIASRQDLFGQLWKEYALSDSRYVTSDTFMLCVEGLTVFIFGPLCFLTALSIARNSRSRYLLQLVVSLGHLYSVALYYGTCAVDFHRHGMSHSRPEFQYYWVYYAGFNAPWVVVPIVILFQSVRQILAKEKALRDINGFIQSSKLLEQSQEAKKTR